MKNKRFKHLILGIYISLYVLLSLYKIATNASFSHYLILMGIIRFYALILIISAGFFTTGFLGFYLIRTASIYLNTKDLKKASWNLFQVIASALYLTLLLNDFNNGFFRQNYGFFNIIRDGLLDFNLKNYCFMFIIVPKFLQTCDIWIPIFYQWTVMLIATILYVLVFKKVINISANETVDKLKIESHCALNANRETYSEIVINEHEFLNLLLISITSFHRTYESKEETVCRLKKAIFLRNFKRSTVPPHSL
jgi:hypothetical protein